MTDFKSYFFLFIFVCISIYCLYLAYKNRDVLHSPSPDLKSNKIAFSYHIGSALGIPLGHVIGLQIISWIVLVIDFSITFYLLISLYHLKINSKS